jgi:hypothetical protein
MGFTPNSSAVSLVLTALTLACYGGNDDEEPPNSLPGGRGGSTSSSGGYGNTGNEGGSGAVVSGGTSGGGSGGGGNTGPVYDAPTITSFSPVEGDYGTLVTIEGSGLGSAYRDGVVLAVGDQGEVELYPDSSPEVLSWSEERIEFRFPFPARGGVSIETPEGAELAGHFEPSWVELMAFENGPSAAVLASVSTGPLQLAVLFDGTPPRLFEFGEDVGNELTIDAGDALPSSLRLYLDDQGVLQGFGLTDEADPEIVALNNEAGELVAAPSGVLLGATEWATAGGPDGAAIWMRRDDGWHRARPSGGTWSLDKGPVEDPMPDEPLHASGATSDGSLYIGYGVDSGSLFDDMERPRLLRLPPADSEFAASITGGHSTDDYLTSLKLEGRGRGLVVHYCGSDVDPFGATSTDYLCFRGLVPSEAVTHLVAPVEGEHAVHTMTKNLALASSCDDDQSYTLRESTDAEMDPAEGIVFTCRTPVALEVDQNDQPVFLMRDGATLRAMVRRPTN